MSLSVETLAVARKYTDDSLAGAGAVAGVPCKIQSITAITGGNRVTFLWTDNNGDDHTSAMDVMNGVDGEDGKGIQSVSVNAQNHLIITYTDGTTVDAGQIEIHSSVDSVNGQTGAVVLDAEDVGALPDNTPIPSKTSDLTNDSGFATTSDVSTALADYTKTADLTTLLAAKQDTLTFDNVPTENSNNPVKSGGVYAANQTLTNQVNVNGAKNLCPNNKVGTTVVQGGLTWGFNSDGTVSVTGTNTQDFNTFYIGTTEPLKNGETYVISGSKYVPSGNCYIRVSKGGTIIADDHKGTPASFVADGGKYDVILYLRTINVTYDVTFKPMICLKSLYDADPTYVPYAKTNQQLTKDTTGLLDNLEVNGAVNMLPNTATTQTINGVTFTVNDDGSITFSGTASSNTYFTISTFTLSAGTYKLNGANGGVQYKVDIQLITGGNLLASDYGDGATFTLASDTAITARIRVESGYAISGTFVFKPMITLASYNGDYVPYAKTNKELTEDVTAIDNARIMYGVENILPNTLESGTAATSVTYTRNSDGTVSISGSAVGNAILPIGKITGLTKVRLTGCPSGGGSSAYQIQPKDLTDNSYPFLGDYGEGKNYTLDPTHVYRMDIVIREGYSISGTKLFKPMVVDLSAYSGTTYGDYVPYAKTNQQLTKDSVTWDNLSEVGAVNLLNHNAHDMVQNGITFTVNPDRSVTANGTATAEEWVQIAQNVVVSESARLSGCPKGGTPSTYFISISVDGVSYREYGDGVIIPSGTISSVYLVIKPNETVNNIVFKPMITPVSYNGPYVPYAKTNKELTDDVTRLDRDAVKIVDSGIINENSSRSFTCTNYEGYRLSIYSIGGNTMGMIVLFGKHPSVSDVRFSIFNCENRNPDAPQISVSGSTLTITTTTFNCYYVIERILGT